MTENEKLDLILTEMQGMKTEIQGMKTEMQDIKTEMQGMKTEMQDMKEKVNKLALGQIELKKEIYMINRKISDTYNLALDALGTSAENRTLLENGTLV